jgi:hypothetical protein
VNPLEEYRRRLTDPRSAAECEYKLFQRVGNARLLIGIAGVVVAFFVFGEVLISVSWLIIPLIAFIVLVVIHSGVVQRLERARRAVDFYERGLARMENRWMGKGESGDRFRDPNHVYAEDLDLFGKGSMFELLSTARTRAGEDFIARWLKAPAERTEAAARQIAVQELRDQLDLREELAVLGDAVRSSMHPETVAAWGTAPQVAFPPGAPWIAGILAAAVVITFGLYMAQITTRTPFMAVLLLDLGYGFFLGPRTLKVIGAVTAPAHDLALFAKLLARLEGERFNAPLLKRIQANLTSSKLVASAEIDRLQRLVSRLDWARNIFFTPIAMAILWSAQLAMAVERWRLRAGPHLEDWIGGVGEFEALFALAGYCFEHPNDMFPDLVETPGGLIDAEGLAHPLMPETQCIPNDVRLGGDLRLLIVSGSNMSGKSTLMRSVGLNVVLAFAGAPVRARKMTVSPLTVGASIRVQDSLQDGKSRFYAEITRLREVVNLASGPRTLLFLLDELLSGTNSHDRRIGAEGIVRSLVNRGAIGMITTHDLALARIEGDLTGRAINVHFADTLVDGKLIFDYHLMPGVVERSNALDLMRSVGLDV